MLDGSYFFECHCGSDEDVLRFILDKKEKEIYISIFLDNYGFLKRLWKGIKYIFGYKCKYGHFNNWTMVAEDANRLIDMVNEFKKL